MSEDRFTIEFEQECDGRWMAEVLELPGCLAYGHTQQEAWDKVIEIMAEVAFADEGAPE